MAPHLTTPLDASTRLQTGANVRCREIGGEAVLLDLDAGTYFGLNAAGTVVWRNLERGATLGEVQAALTAGFQVDPERAWTDLVELVGDLLDRGLVSVTRGTATAP